jgi:hypothetical protein
MIDWIRTVRGIAAIVAVIFATLVAWWNPGLPRLVFSPEAPIHARSRCSRRSTPTPSAWCSTNPWWSANPLGTLWPEMMPDS